MSDEESSIRAISLSLRQLVLGWERYREDLADELGIGPTDVVALSYLHLSPSITPSEIGPAMNLTSGSVTSLLNRLERAGFVARHENPDDRRSVLVKPTPGGRHATQWLFERIDELVAATLSGRSELDCPSLIDFLQAFAAGLAASTKGAV